MEPLAGAAPAGSPYKGNLQAAAKRRRNGLPSRSLTGTKARLRTHVLRRGATRGADGEGWWAATVLPRVLRFKRPLHHSLMLAARKLVAIPSAALGGAGL